MVKKSSTSTLLRVDSGIDITSESGHHESSSELQSCSSTPPSISHASTSGSEQHLQEQNTEQKKWWDKFWPPRGWVAKWFTWMLVLGLVFGALWALDPEKMKPYESNFGLVITIILCFAAEGLIVKVPMPKGFPPIPPLLASLLMGLALRNLPSPLNVAYYIEPHASNHLRELALTVILTRAGLEIDPAAMAKVKWAVARLAFLPCIGETVMFGVISHFLFGFPFEWSFMAGFMLAAVSPAVVIPSLILLQDVGLGIVKGVPSLVMAASGIDDVLAIAGFTVLLGIAIPSGLEEEIIHSNDVHALSNRTWFNITDNTTATGSPEIDYTVTTPNSTSAAIGSTDVGREVVGALIEVVIGIVAGLFLGFFISYIPPSKMQFKAFCRGFLLLSIGILFVFGSEVWGIPGSGTLCALIMSFVAAFHWGEGTGPLEKAWHYMWVIFQPILFGLTGTLVDVNMMDATTCGLGIATLVCSMAARLTVSTSVTFGQKFNLKEKIFVSISWIPKGTVQAALGSSALDLALKLDRPDQEVYWATQILVLAVLATLITAPIGAFGISFFGPKLLSANTGDSPNPHDNEAFTEVDPPGSPSSVQSHESHRTAFSTSTVDSVLDDQQHPRQNNNQQEDDHNHHHCHNCHHCHLPGLNLHNRKPSLDDIKEEAIEAEEPTSL